MTESYAQQFFTLTQYGPEITHGAAPAAASIFPGETPKITSDTKLDFSRRQMGLRVEETDATAYETLYTNSMLINKAGFQQMLLGLQCGVKKVTLVETTIGQHDYKGVWSPNLTAAAGINNPDSFVLEVGDNVQAYQIAYCMVDKISIKFHIPQDGGAALVSIDYGYFGRQLVQHAFTPALSAKSVTPINAKLTRLYMDTTWAALGVTELAGLLRGGQIDIYPNNHPDFTGSANTYFGAHKEGTLKFNATFTLEGGTTAHALLAAQQAGALKFLRLAFNGPAIGTGLNSLAQFDMAGVFESVGPMDSNDRGDNLSTIGFHGVYDKVSAKAIEATVITDTLTI